MTSPIEERLAVAAAKLQPIFDAASLPASTAEIAPLADVLGQERAREAIVFGLRMVPEGYNIAVSGPPSSGRNTIVGKLVAEAAAGRPPSPDWCYLHNFADPRRPHAVSLPSGLGDDLHRAVAQLQEACRTALPSAFASEGYERRGQEVLEPIGRARELIIEQLQASARTKGFAINPSPVGLVPVPMAADGTPLTPEVYNALTDAQRHDWEGRSTAVQEEIVAAGRELRKLETQARQAVEALDREVTRFVVGPIIDELERVYGPYGLMPHLAAVEDDIVANLEVYKRFTEGLADRVPPQLVAQFGEEREALLKRYSVNLFVTHGDQPSAAAPVVDERHPRYHNLFGKMDFENRMGAMVTDFTRIRPGSIHMANGGYLILQVQDLLADPRSWVKLKEALKTREIRIEDPGEGILPMPMVDLSPQGIPLDLKVVLVGQPFVFGLFDALDPDFPELFKIRAEFEPDTDCTGASAVATAGFIRQTRETCHLLHFDRGALAEVLGYSNRLAGRRDRFSTRYGLIADLCQEASQVAVSAGAATVGAEHVRGAFEARARRSGLVPDRLRRMIAEGTLRIETSGSVVGQVNGLAVYSMGSHEFGTPTRITCRTGLGRRGVVAIERETERSGAIHTKGVLVLSGYLQGTFGRSRPLAFSASLTFEQSYDEVEGDSASSAELYAILASLAGVPIRQDIAVTGSVDQFGNIQAIGGVTEKVEGFFDLCKEVGLTGSQGVALPASNVINLTLRGDVAAAIARGEFHLWSVTRVEEGLELLTGVAAGAADSQGNYPVGSLFYSVAATLDDMRALSGPAEANGG
ncbi:MAG: AAA family ATPase [Chloroflexi bacterium]|nr:AAA family ATPase [Chloroflexota bacterium]